MVRITFHSIRRHLAACFSLCVIASSLLCEDPASVVLLDFDQVPAVGGSGTTTIITDILAVHAG